jgi:hypothetical protein
MLQIFAGWYLNVNFYWENAAFIVSFRPTHGFKVFKLTLMEKKKKDARWRVVFYKWPIYIFNIDFRNARLERLNFRQKVR